MSFGSMSVIWIYERPRQGIASEPKKMSPKNDSMPTQFNCLSTSSILNHDFLNKYTRAESEGIKPIVKIARRTQAKAKLMGSHDPDLTTTYYWYLIYTKKMPP